MTPSPSSAPTFFATAAAFRRWLAKHHRSETELWVGYHKKATGEPSMTWAESVEQALCFGWIDGLRKSLGERSYMIRFTPRKERSPWSLVNVRTVNRLIAEGLMEPAGMAAFERRSVERVGPYSFENKDVTLDEAHEREFKKDRAAWRFFESQPPGYRRTAAWYVVSAKKEETRQKRLARLIADSGAGRRIGMLENARRKAAPTNAAVRKPAVKKKRRGSS
jgi:uncharacterized protein YdeI (YjbR/CyaY-like superfamily)